MTFKLASRHLYWWPVFVPVPDPDPKRPGSVQKHEVRLHFEAMPQDEGAAFDAEHARLIQNDRSAYDAALLKRVVRGWDGVVDDDNEPIAFSEDALGQAVQSMYFRLAAARAYVTSLTGEGAKKGN